MVLSGVPLQTVFLNKTGENWREEILHITENPIEKFGMSILFLLLFHCRLRQKMYLLSFHVFYSLFFFLIKKSLQVQFLFVFAYKHYKLMENLKKMSKQFIDNNNNWVKIYKCFHFWVKCEFICKSCKRNPLKNKYTALLKRNAIPNIKKLLLCIIF